MTPEELDKRIALTVQNLLESLDVKVDLTPEQYLYQQQNTKQLISDVVEELLPTEAQTQEWSDEHKRFVLHREEVVEGFNACLDTIRSNKAKLLDHGKES